MTLVYFVYSNCWPRRYIVRVLTTRQKFVLTVVMWLYIIPYLTTNKYSLLRPIAGAINFCPSQFAVRSDDENIRIGIHEVVHALVRETATHVWCIHLSWSSIFHLGIFSNCIPFLSWWKWQSTYTKRPIWITTNWCIWVNKLNSVCISLVPMQADTACPWLI